MRRQHRIGIGRAERRRLHRHLRPVRAQFHRHDLGKQVVTPCPISQAGTATVSVPSRTPAGNALTTRVSLPATSGEA
jgi:hypothetical protein